MSAIAGHVAASDGRGGETALVTRLLGAMAHRAPDGVDVVRAGAAALGHGALATRFGPGGPVDRFRSETLVVIADVRLDNRDALLAELAIASARVSDADIIAAAYRRHGSALVEHLLGDFAFAIWDVVAATLLCARDHLGVKPLHYRHDAEGFAFASELAALRATAPAAPIDEQRIADFLAGFIADEQGTVYEDILRLPPAHLLILADGAVSLRRYWSPDPDRAIDPPDAPAEFAALFAQAVEARLQGEAPLGAMLSGGLDSSAVAAVAMPLARAHGHAPLPTFSLTYDRTPEWSERRFQEAVLARGGFAPRFVPLDDHPPLDGLDEVVALQGLSLAPNVTVSRTLYRAAARAGVRVLLDGHGGDEVISHGYGRLVELAAASDWLGLWRSLPAVADTYGMSRGLSFLAYVARYARFWRVRQAAHGAVGLIRRFGPRGQRAQVAQPPVDRFIADGLARRTDVAARWRATHGGRGWHETARSEHHAGLINPLRAHAFEILDRMAAAEGIEARYPFFDKRVVEFCLALPARHKLDGKWSRVLIRQAMRGILPDMVRGRRDKLNFGQPMAVGIVRHHRESLRALLAGAAPRIGGYVKLDAILAAYDRIVADPLNADGFELQAVWRAAVLALWLDEPAAARPVAATDAVAERVEHEKAIG